MHAMLSNDYKRKVCCMAAGAPLHFVVRVGVDLHLHRVHVLVCPTFCNLSRDSELDQNLSCDLQKKSRSLKGSRPSVPHGTIFFITFVIVESRLTFSAG